MHALFTSLMSIASPCSGPCASLLLGFDTFGALVSIEATDNEITVQATRGTSARLVTVGAKAARSSRLDLPALTLDSDGFLVSGGTHLPGEPTDGFPSFPPVPESDATCPAFPASLVLRAVGYAILEDDNRYGLNGLHLETLDSDGNVNRGGGFLRAVSTDGSRLALLDTGATVDGNLPRHMLLPRAALSLVARVFGDASPALTWHDRCAVFSGTVDGWTVRVHVRLVDGEFPAYRQVLRNKNLGTVRVDRAALVDTLKRLVPVATDYAHTVRVWLQDGQLHLSARSLILVEKAVKKIKTAPAKEAIYRDGPAAHYRIPCVATGKVPDTGFNVNLLLDAAASYHPSPEVTLSYDEYLAPCHVTDPADPSRFAIVMPIRLDGAICGGNVEPVDVSPAPVKPARKVAARKAAATVAPSGAVPTVKDLEILKATIKEQAESFAQALDQIKGLQEVARVLSATRDDAVKERDSLRAQVDDNHKTIKRLENHRAIDADVIKALRADLETARNAPPCPAVTVDQVTADAFGMAGLPGVTVAPSPLHLVDSPAPSPEGPPVSPCTRAEDAPTAYARARQALSSKDPASMRAALAGLPVWPSKKNDSLKTELTAALRKVA